MDRAEPALIASEYPAKVRRAGGRLKCRSTFRIVRSRGPCLSLAALFLLHAVGGAQTHADPFAFFSPPLAVSRDDIARLDGGKTLVRTLPRDDGEIAIVAIVAVRSDGARLAEWVRHIAALKKSSYVHAIARFSDPPRLEDLATLNLDDDDLDALRQCRPDDCALRLSASEIDTLHRAVSTNRAASNPLLQAAFRRLMLMRVETYLATGQEGLPRDVSDHASAVPTDALASIVTHSGFLRARLPALADSLEHYPMVRAPRAESFLYWSQEDLAGRTIVSVTHVNILHFDDPGFPEVLVTGKQVFESRYLNGALNVTAIVRSESGARHYLVYINRSSVDVLDRWYGGLARLVIERRITGEAAGVLQGLRDRLDAGPPPQPPA